MAQLAMQPAHRLAIISECVPLLNVRPHLRAWYDIEGPLAVASAGLTTSKKISMGIGFWLFRRKYQQGLHPKCGKTERTQCTVC